MTYPMGHTAEVRAHDRVMRYRRWGAGSSVLLLAADLWPGLAERLALEFKVIVPELPDGGCDVADWLYCLLEGIGATEIAVVAGAYHAEVTLALAQSDYVSRVVVFSPEISVDEALARIRQQLSNSS